MNVFDQTAEARGLTGMNNNTNPVQHVFIIGAKGFGNYGGYETFVDKLTEMHRDNPKIKYHVACKANGSGSMDERKLPSDLVTRIDDTHFVYHNADCLKIRVPEKLNSAQAIYYDIHAMRLFISYCRQFSISHPVFYILACRIGPWIGNLAAQIHEMGGKLFVNPDGHEWLRTKWSVPIRMYWKHSEKLMVKHADLLVCDSLNIEKYIKREYEQFHPVTRYIAYGADITPSTLADDDPVFTNWIKKSGLQPEEYYLIVGRFVPENNFETMIREYMKCGSKRNLAIVTTDNEMFLTKLNRKLHFKNDPRIRFVGTVYNHELLRKIREKAYAYLHGHSVGGTNPSLLESLGATKLNLLFNVGFNREVGLDAALYWTKEPGNLAALLDKADSMSAKKRESYGKKARERVQSAYSWEFIAGEYEKLWEDK